ncbi:MAG: sigma-70 family RNA polymerase sigma factor [Lewinellaceae bacterium]|nr:sigma-70 family RNA polymerase sigma factor [Lewinellaceae bacterium]
MEDNLPQDDPQRGPTPDYSARWERLVNGERETVDALYREGYLFVRNILKNEPLQTVEDVHHDVFILFYNKLLAGAFDPKYAPEAFFKGIAKNKCFEYRKKRSKLFKFLSMLKQIWEQHYDPEELSVVEQMEEIELMRSCIDAAQLGCQQVFKLKYFENKSDTEIAEILGLTPQYVSLKRHRCLGYIAKCYEKKSKNGGKNT